jgi:LytS/YehU family sensor histidine kinase
LFIAVLTIFLSAIFVYFNQRKKTKQQKTELKLKLLRSQMDPHFIFNALGSIQSFMYQNESVKAASYLGQYSSLTRSVLKNSNKELITLEEELETLKNYIEIEKMRKRDCFNYELEIDENVEPDFIYVPPIFLQPFVENAIQHGFAKKDCNQGMIFITIKQQPTSIQINITDNGQGINSTLKNKKDSTHQSMGMKIFKERIHLIERKYKKTIKFEVYDLSEKNPELTGTSVNIDFPIIEPDDKSSHNRRRTRIT